MHPTESQGIRCDCCSAEPIQGLRFACLNVADVNICQSCANIPGQSFSAGGNPFIGLQWNVLATTEDTAALPQHSSAQVGTIADLPRISKEIEVRAMQRLKMCQFCLTQLHPHLTFFLTVLRAFTGRMVCQCFWMYVNLMNTKGAMPLLPLLRRFLCLRD